MMLDISFDTTAHKASAESHRTHINTFVTMSDNVCSLRFKRGIKKAFK